MSQSPQRIKAYSCIGPYTDKYYLPDDQVAAIWASLEQKYGPVRQDETFRIMEIRSSAFIFRALLKGNPITVIRKRRCRAEDINDLHEMIGFDRDEH